MNSTVTGGPKSEKLAAPRGAYARVFSGRLDYPGYHNPAFCHLDVFTSPAAPPVVVATEALDNEGTSVTNCAEVIAQIACHNFGIDPRTLIFVEHYLRARLGFIERRRNPEDDTYAEVFFAIHPSTGKLTGPKFEHRGRAWLEARVGLVEDDMAGKGGDYAAG